jgi:hypothetical protein
MKIMGLLLFLVLFALSLLLGVLAIQDMVNGSQANIQQLADLAQGAPTPALKFLGYGIYIIGAVAAVNASL